MEALLSSVGLAYLAENFKKHKIGIQEASKLDDQQLNELGVQTIGEKIRLKEKLKEGTTGGRRGAVNLGSILKFATGTEEEPVLGFVIHPSIYFAECQTVLPTANTCVNRLTLTRPHDRMQMPSQEELFSLYDIAFCNSYFGLE